VQEVINDMERCDVAFILDERLMERNRSDIGEDDNEDFDSIDTQEHTSGGIQHMEMGYRHHDVKFSCKKRARALNDVVEEEEWRDDYGFGEGSRPQALGTSALLSCCLIKELLLKSRN